MKHAIFCTFPEGCSCGASDWNAKDARIKTLEAENLRLREALEKCEQVFDLFRDVRGGDGALKPAVDAVNKALGNETI